MLPVHYKCAFAVLLSIFVAALQKLPICSAQTPTVAPVESEPAKPSADDPTFEDTDFSIFFAGEEIEEAVKAKNYKRASILAQKYIAVAEANGLDEAAIRDMKSFLVGAVLVPNAEYLDAIHVLDDLLKTKPDPKLLLLRALALHHAGWHDATLNELRRTIRRYPDETLLRGMFASELLEFPASNELDAYETLTAVLPLQDRINEEPRLAEAIALAAATSGDFDIAVEMQKKFLGTVGPRDRELETQKLARYEAKQAPPRASMPAWDPTKLLSNDQLSDLASRSMVMVRVIRRFELTDDATGGYGGKTEIVHTHRGTVLSSMGTILISSETVRPIRADEHQDLTITGTSRTLKEEIIEVFTMPADNNKREFIGRAIIQGIDVLSGLAVLEIDHEKPYRNIQYDELTPIVFQPEYRPLDPNTKLHLGKHLEFSNGKLGLDPKPLLRNVTLSESENSAYLDLTLQQFTMARIRGTSDSQSPIGTPIFNQLGECIGITHQVGADKTDRIGVIPAAVCTRIASKIMADGVVHRAKLPIVACGMLTNAETPSMGMFVYRVLSEEKIYQSLSGQWIVGVNGIPTPTLTEWLAVLERANALGWKTMVVEAYDDGISGTACLEVPILP